MDLGSNQLGTTFYSEYELFKTAFYIQLSNTFAPVLY